MKVTVKIKLLHPDAKLPRLAYRGDACYDICALEDTIIPAGKSKLVRSGFASEVSEDWEIQLRPRSHQSYDTYLPSFATLDSNYRGDCGPLLHNFSDKDYQVKRGDRVAQMAVRPIPRVTFKVVDELSQSERGERGFGSSGK